MTQLGVKVYSPPMMNGWQHNGAFVIKFRQDTNVNTGDFYGRVEHVASRRQKRFDSLEELMEFLYSILRDVQLEFQRADTLTENLQQ
jgi:hypothetical protein